MDRPWKDLTDDDLRLMHELEMDRPLRQGEIQLAIADGDWQEFRRDLKGLPTSTKLRLLRSYKERRRGEAIDIQVDNYLNALRRGGQLPPKGKS